MEDAKISDEILTVNETAKFLKICRVNAYNLFNRKNFPSFRIGKSLRIRKQDLLKYISTNLISSSSNTIN